MTATITPLRLCQCGKPGSPLTITVADKPDASPLHCYACDECLAEVTTQLDAVRPVFATMLACAVPKNIADATMAFLLAKLDEDEEGGDEIETN